MRKCKYCGQEVYAGRSHRCSERDGEVVPYSASDFMVIAALTNPAHQDHGHHDSGRGRQHASGGDHEENVATSNHHAEDGGSGGDGGGGGGGE